MGVKTALVLLVPSAAYGFWLPPPHAVRSTHNRCGSCSSSRSSCNNGVHRKSSELVSRGIRSSAAGAFEGGLRRRAPRKLVLEAGGEPDTHGTASATGVNPRQRVSRALNRALGNIVAAGDMFGSVSKSVSDDNSFGRHFSSNVGREDEEVDDDEDDEDYDEEDADGDEEQDAQDVEDLFAGGSRLSTRRFGQNRRKSSANRLLRAKTEASAAVVVDGPFDKLQAYMTLPVSEYSLLDSSIIRRVSETSFRFQIPLRDFVGLDFTPTMEVEVELDAQAKAVVFRSVRSTLYGNIGKPGEEASSNPWPEASLSKVEYFQLAFDARLRWVDGDASKAPRQRGRGGFSGGFARRPRPTPPPVKSPVLGAESAGESCSGAASVGRIVGGDGGGDAMTLAAGGQVGERGGGGNEELAEKAEPATVFCETEIKVRVLLPPPYNTLLPWRLVRVLLGKLLSTIVAYVLPRFLELLADDFYGWQSGSRQAAATAGEMDRTLLGAKGGGSGSGSRSERAGRNRFSSLGARQLSDGARGEGGAAAATGGREGAGAGASRRGGGSAAVGNNRSGSSSSSSDNNRNPVVGGIQRLRNVRGPGGGRVGGRTAGGEEAAAATTSSAATLHPTPREEASSGRRSAPGEDRFQDWSASSAPPGGAPADDFTFEVSVGDDDDEKGGDDDGRRQQRWRRGWRGSGDRGVEGGSGDGGGGGGSGGGGGGGPINWWG
eukprot:g4293.t1